MTYPFNYRGYVLDRADPEKRGRLKLKVYDVYGDDEHDYWALPKGLFSGDGIGLMAIPEKGDMVWVQFEAGDAAFPIWDYGGWAKDKGLPLAYDDDGQPTRLLLVSKGGHSVAIDDKANTIELTLKDGPSIKLDKDYISLIKKDGKVSLGSAGGSAEPAVLGDKNAEALNTLHDIVQQLVQAFSQDIAASSGNPYLVYANAATMLPQAVTKLAQLSTQITKTKSIKVTLD